jgi:hypothetical protein
MTFNPELCEERHKNITKEFEAVWKRLANQDKKLWTIILLGVGNLAGLITVLVKAVLP